LPKRVEQLALALLDALAGGEHALLVGLERWRDEPLSVGDGLSALIVGGDEMQVRLRDLDVVAEHLVESDLERLNAGPRAFVGLYARDGIATAVAQRPKLVQLGVDSRRDRRLVAHADGGVIDKRSPNVARDVGAVVPRVQ
jgi:hypothetical protein